MKFRKNLILLLICMLGGLSSYTVFAADPLCSDTPRGNDNIETYEQMYNRDNTMDNKTKSYISSIKPSVVRNTTVIGNKNRFDNKKGNCGNGGNPSSSEYSDWDNRWNYNDRRSKAGVAHTATASELSLSDVTNMQKYINSECGLGISTDGRLGKKTLHSIKLCLPPCDGDCEGRSSFTNLASVLYKDSAGKQPILNSNLFVSDYDPSQTMYINPNASQLNNRLPNALGLGIIQPSGSSEDNNSLFAAPPPKLTPTNSDDKNDYENSKILCEGDNGLCKSGCKKDFIMFKEEDGKTLDPQRSYAICRKCDPVKCNCGVKLNTNVPFIGRCIVYGMTNDTRDTSYGGNSDTIVVNPLNAFPVLMTGIVKILMTVFLLICFGALIMAGVMMTIPDQYDRGKKLIWKVVGAIALLGTSGIILYLINPNFFF